MFNTTSLFRFLVACAAIALCAAGSSAASATATDKLPDPLQLRPLNPAFDLYPDSSLANFAYLLDAPAGKHGFVQSRDGHFYFENGQRARFWGVTITQEHIDIPKQRIDEVVDNLARAGCNMVRFHSLDNRAGLQYGFLRRTIVDDAPPNDKDTQHFDKEYRDRLDYWIARLKERGIYSFIVLRAFRSYRDGDQVANAELLPRGATPMAFFNPRLIQLQKQYARDLLIKHVNPYTKLPLGKDPAVALIEVFNEDSLFSRPGMWQNMIEPYRTEFHELWGSYLRNKYKTTPALRAAWTNAEGQCALADEESLEKNNVGLPDMNATEGFEQAQSEPYVSVLKSPARRREAVLFAIDVQDKYFHQMTEALTEMGVKVPSTGVVAGSSVPDTFSAAREFAFTAENMYQEHPIFEPGREWLPPFYYHNGNYLRENDPYTGMPFVTRYRWAGKPLAVREWATCWPNPYRAASIMEMASYGRFQDIDALIYFAYYTTGDFTKLDAFDLNNDPTRWGLFGYGARVFLGRDSVRPASRKVQIGYSLEDMGAYSSWMDALHSLSWVHAVENVLRTQDFQSQADLMITSGRSHTPGYHGQRAIIFSPAEYVTAEQKARAIGSETLWAKSGYPLAGQTSTTALRPFTREDIISSGLEPFPADTSAMQPGAFDPKRSNLILGRIAFDDVPAFAYEATHKLYGTPMTSASLAAGQLLSDTGELVRSITSGTLTIDAPCVQVVQGEMTSATAMQTPSGLLRVLSQSPFAAVVAVSLDDKPLTASTHFSVKMVTVAENRKQQLDPAKHPAMAGSFVMTTQGTYPIVTQQHPLSDRATTVWLNGRKLASVYLENGTWELVFDTQHRRIDVFCDLPNVRFELPTPTGNESYSLQPYYNETPPDKPYKVGNEFQYPGWAKYARLSY